MDSGIWPCTKSIGQHARHQDLQSDSRQKMGGRTNPYPIHHILSDFTKSVSPQVLHSTELCCGTSEDLCCADRDTIYRVILPRYEKQLSQSFLPVILSCENRPLSVRFTWFVWKCVWRKLNSFTVNLPLELDLTCGTINVLTLRLVDR